MISDFLGRRHFGVWHMLIKNPNFLSMGPNISSLRVLGRNTQLVSRTLRTETFWGYNPV